MSTGFVNEEEHDNEEQSLESRTVSRREFLKYAGIAGAALSLGGGLGGLLAACGDDSAATTTTSAVSGTTATTAGGATTTAAGGATTTVAAGADTTPWYVGGVADVTGPLATIGVDLKDGFDLEIEKLNAEGGVKGHPIKIIWEDSAGDPQKSTAAFTKLTQQDKVPFTTGPAASATNAQAMVISEREQIPNVMFAPDDTMWRDGKFWKFTYNLVAPGPVQGQGIYCLCKANNITNLTLITDNEVFFIDGGEYCTYAADAWGIKLDLLPDQHQVGQLDMTSLATKIKASIEKNQSQAVGMLNIGADGLNLVRALKKIGITPTAPGGATSASSVFMFGEPAWGQSQLLDISNGDLDNTQFFTDSPVVCTELPDDAPDKAFLVDMKTRFEAKYDRYFSGIAAHMYTVTNFIKMSMGEVGPDPLKIQNYLDNNIKNFVGSEGIINYSPTDHAGLKINSYKHILVKNDKYTLSGLDMSKYVPAGLPPEFADPGFGAYL